MKKRTCLAILLAILLGIPGISAAQDELVEGIDIGGALRVNYTYTDWNESSRDKIGDFAFDTFRLNLDGEIGEMLLSAEYRWYPEYDFDTIHHGWIGYQFNENLQGQVGVHQVPFGLQPYASHNFWFSGAYYIGLEDDYDMGLKALYDVGNWDLAFAFYKNAELGAPSDAGRYSIDVISDGTNLNEETNQGNIRAAYTFTHSDEATTEVGLSGQYGGLYNSGTGDTGDHWATAAHLNGTYGRWNIQLEGIAYEYNPENTAAENDDIINIGGYSFTWGMPAKGTCGIFNVAYGLPVDIGPISKLTFYSDNTVIEPDDDAFDTIWQNVVGMMISSGPVYTYVDLISGENMVFSGGSFVAPDNERTTRLNINVGYYF